MSDTLVQTRKRRRICGRAKTKIRIARSLGRNFRVPRVKVTTAAVASRQLADW